METCTNKYDCIVRNKTSNLIIYLSENLGISDFVTFSKKITLKEKGIVIPFVF